MTVLDVTALTKYYPTFQLDNISFQLAAGTITGFVGANGAGKSTTLKAILGLLNIDHGQITYFGKNFFHNQTAIKQDLAFVDGGITYFPRKKLRTLTDTTARFYANWDAQRYQTYLEKFQLDDRKTPHELSTGMRIKYALAVALSHHAKLLILDEPTSGLDPVSRDELLTIFLDLRAQGVTILFSTHIINDLQQCADNILYLHQGQLLFDAPLTELLARYQLITITDPTDLSQAQKQAFQYAKAEQVNGQKLWRGLTQQPDLFLDSQRSAVDLETLMVHIERGVALVN
ncbi:ABC transporter ATP-binding protein [Lactobacillus sp. CC-MHH1034]|uniref:ABC transporter ATP-binding protein n=1 Tax=Agrilactobacillus fermenti TaxID=2586909 RepID=UPI001E3FE46F|nr:ABC transporter ATP-binding protein [Agrilactobacillus fermenti]MCD2255692.1 ABC transporter ATP-binding protein [Agrilactobacillus fermenti]